MHIGECKEEARFTEQNYSQSEKNIMWPQSTMHVEKLNTFEETVGELYKWMHGQHATAHCLW